MGPQYDISGVLEKSKDYEYLVTTHDPAYSDLVNAIEIVKKFIIDNRLLIYGGTAIDFALRLVGDNIYPDNMLAVPDLDMYSPDNVNHAYQLADLLYHAGYKDVRAINAQHMETMRVDLVNDHFIADITYRPREIFDKIPYLEYNSMRIVHPMFQRLDLHSSLSFPYDNPPREVIFHRWSKDIKRFNKLNSHYPISVTGDRLSARPHSIPVEIARKYVLNGFAAYSVIYTKWAEDMRTLGAANSAAAVPAAEINGAEFTYDAFNGQLELIHYDVEKAAQRLGLGNVKYYEAYINMTPERCEGVATFGRVIIHSTKHRLISANEVILDDMHIRIVNVQYLLKYFLSMYFISHSAPRLANLYLSRYTALLHMITTLEDALDTASDETRERIMRESPLFPSVETYGNDNISLARSVALNRLYADLGDATLFNIPWNYYPGRSIPAGRGHPEFDYESSPFFQERGREIKK